MRQSLTTLDGLRREIDEIDEALHDLLMRRAAVSREVARFKPPSGSRKPGPPAIRPAREAAILRRLAARHRGDLPLDVVIRIWREILAASLQAQTRFHVHVVAGDDEAGFLGMTHAYFGSLTPVHTHKTAELVVQACAEEPDSFGIVPMPENTDAGRPWWSQLAPVGRKGPRVFAKLPFITNGTGGLSAYAIGAVEQEASGDDTTLLLVESAGSLSSDALHSLFARNGVHTTLSAAGSTADRSRRQVLLEAAGLVPQNDARLSAVRNAAGDAIARVDVVGGFANRIVVKAEKP